ncbi:MAG: cytidine deaminase [Thermomicrobiales bacterium]|nr:cytidine deaminase [Thermomicrobiales bacterium]
MPTTSTIDHELAERLMSAARDAATRAYAPYSTFPVGAAAYTASGEIVTGCNVENVSYGLTCCAERTACFTAAAAGHRTIVAIAVTAPKVETVTPCGACRQVLNEFRPRDGEMMVILDGATRLTQVPLSDLLPRAFGPHDLDDANRSS